MDANLNIYAGPDISPDDARRLERIEREAAAAGDTAMQDAIAARKLELEAAERSVLAEGFGITVDQLGEHRAAKLVTPGPGVRAFRKKPVVIQARQLPPAPCDEVIAAAAWCEGVIGEDSATGVYCVAIATLEGVMRADPGDWIIRGVQGEFYPCKPDIFAATYELVGDVDATEA